MRKPRLVARCGDQQNAPESTLPALESAIAKGADTDTMELDVAMTMNPRINETLSDFPVLLPIVVRFRDLDAMGHVNNAVYLTYFEMARVAYHRAVTDVQAFDFTSFDFILAEVTCSYRSPAYMGETLLVGIRVSSVGRKSFVFEYEMRDQASGRLVAEGRSVQVMYDYGERRSKPVTNEFLAKVEALQGHPVQRETAEA